ncbi:MAG: flotillin family protein [Myxococcota bacterium]
MEGALADAILYGGGFAAAMWFTLFITKTFLIIGRPNELVIFSGRSSRLPSGEEVGWRYISGGRSFRIPILEEVSVMDLTTMPIDIHIRGAYAKGNIPVNVDAVANAKITLEEPYLHNAIERFLGKSQAELRSVAKETLEGTLRGVLARLTPEEINHDRQKLAEELKSEVRDDLEKMGLMVDTFKIQHVADDKNYLDSISRVRIAEVIRDAEIAESNATRDAEQAIAKAKSLGQVAQENAGAAIAEQENDLSRLQAQLEAQAKSEEERTVAAGRAAQARAEQQLQEVRKVLEELRLQAEVVIPAMKESEAQQLRAAGDAAVKAEVGRAQSEALEALYGAWQTAGDKAREVFLIQQVDEILQDVARAAEGIDIGHVNLIDGGDGRSLSRYVGAYPAIVSELLERIKDTVGVDVAGILTAGSAAGAADSKETT